MIIRVLTMYDLFKILNHVLLDYVTFINGNLSSCVLTSLYFMY